MLQKFFILTIIFGLLVASCSLQPPSNPECGPEILSTPRPFIMTAFHPETEAIASFSEETESCNFNGVTYHLATFEEFEFVYFEGGVGPGLSANTAEATINEFQVEILIFSGISGRLDPSLFLSETVVPSKWMDLNSGVTINISPDLILMAEEIQSVTVVETGVTADHFVVNGDEVYALTGASIVDMETFHVANVADFHHVPFIAFRSVSDFADGDKDAAAYQNAAEASAAAALQFMSIFEEN